MINIYNTELSTVDGKTNNNYKLYINNYNNKQAKK